MNRKWIAACAAAALAISAPATAQDAVGYWQGALTISATMKLRAGVTIERGVNGALTGTFDSIDQNAFGIPLADVELANGELAFKVPAVSGSFRGKWDPAAQAWTGTFTQGGAGIPLVLTAAEPPARTPPAPLPADWSVPGDAALGAVLDERIALRDGVGMVLGVIEPSGTRIVTT